MGKYSEEPEQYLEPSAPLADFGACESAIWENSYEGGFEIKQGYDIKTGEPTEGCITGGNLIIGNEVVPVVPFHWEGGDLELRLRYGIYKHYTDSSKKKIDGYYKVAYIEDDAHRTLDENTGDPPPIEEGEDAFWELEMDGTLLLAEIKNGVLEQDYRELHCFSSKDVTIDGDVIFIGNDEDLVVEPPTEPVEESPPEAPPSEEGGTSGDWCECAQIWEALETLKEKIKGYIAIVDDFLSKSPMSGETVIYNR